MKFADRASELKASDVREILKVAGDPSIISFAGGLPALETLPVDFINKTIDKALNENTSLSLINTYYRDCNLNLLQNRST